MSEFLPPVVARLLADSRQFVGETTRAGTAVRRLQAQMDRAALAAREAGVAQEQAAIRAARAQTVASEAAVRAAAAQNEAAIAARRLAAGEISAAEAANAQSVAQSASTRAVLANREATVAAERADIARTRTQGALVASTNAQTAASGRATASIARFGKTSALVFAAVGVVSVKQAADFQTATNKIHTEAGASVQELEYVRKQILKLSPALGITPKHGADILYHLESVGLRGKVAVDAFVASAKLAKLGGSDLEQTSTALAGAWRSGIQGFQGFTDMAAILNTTIGIGNMRMQDLVNAMSTGILPVFKTVGLTIQDFSASVALSTDNGVRANESMTRLKVPLMNLLSPTLKMQKAFDRVGLTNTQLAEDLRKPRGLLTMLTDLKDHLNKTYPASQKTTLSVKQQAVALADYKNKLMGAGIKGAELTKSVKEMATSLSLTGRSAIAQGKAIGDMFGGGRSSGQVQLYLGELDALKQKYDILPGAGKRITDFEEHWKLKQKELNQQLDRMKATLSKLAVEIGTWLIPKISAVIGWFGRHATITKLLVGALVTLMALSVAVWFGTLAVSVFRAAQAFYALTAAMLANPIVLIGVAIAALVAAVVLLWLNWDKVWNWIAHHKAIATIIGLLAGPILLPIFALVAAIKFLQHHWREIWNDIAGAFVTAWNAIYGFFVRAIADISTWAHTAWFAIKDFFVGIWQSIAHVWETVWLDVKNTVVGAFDAVKGAILTGFHAVVDAFATGIAAVIGFVQQHWRLILFILMGPLGLLVVWLIDHWAKIRRVFEVGLAAIGRVVATGAKTVAAPFVWLGKQIASIATTIWHAVSGAFGAMAREVSRIAVGIWHAVAGYFTNLWNSLTTAAVNGAKAVAAPFVLLGLALASIAVTAWHAVAGFFIGLWHQLTGIAGSIWHSVEGPFRSMASAVGGVVSGLWRTVTGWFDKIRDQITNSVKTAVGWIKGAWNQLFDIFKKPVEFVVNTVYNSGIRPVWNFVAGIVHEPKMHEWHLARGGLIPGYGGGDQLPAMLEPGEAVVDKKRTRQYAWFFRAIGVPGFAGGGLAGAAGGAGAEIATVQGAADGLGGGAIKVLGKAVQFVRGRLADGMEAVFGPLKALIEHTTGVGPDWKGVIGRLGIRPMDKLVDIIRGKDKVEAGHGGGAAPGSNVIRWTSVFLEALKMAGQSASWLPLGLRRMQQESSGDPGIVNTSDINAQRGDPSKGLMQTISSTFNAYAGSLRDRGVFDPLANIYASIMYTLHTYGSLSAWGRPGGYAQGGLVTGPKWYGKGGIVGQHGPEIIGVGESGPEMVVPMATGGIVYNKTGPRKWVPAHMGGGAQGTHLIPGHWTYLTPAQVAAQARSAAAAAALDRSGPRKWIPAHQVGGVGGVHTVPGHWTYLTQKQVAAQTKAGQTYLLGLHRKQVGTQLHNQIVGQSWRNAATAIGQKSYGDAYNALAKQTATGGTSDVPWKTATALSKKLGGERASQWAGVRAAQAYAAKLQHDPGVTAAQRKSAAIHFKTALDRYKSMAALDVKTKKLVADAYKQVAKARTVEWAPTGVSAYGSSRGWTASHHQPIVVQIDGREVFRAVQTQSLQNSRRNVNNLLTPIQ